MPALAIVSLAMLAGSSLTSTAAPAAYSSTQVFGIKYEANQQGLAYADGSYYVGFDERSSVPRALIQYNAAGKEIRRTGALNIGHAAEVGFRKADGKLYVATGGGGTDTVVNVVDMRPTTPQLDKNPYTFASLKGDGMVAVDNVNDQMVVFGGLSDTTHKIALARFSDGSITSHFNVPDLGTPNGLEVLGGQILYLSYVEKRNIVTTFSFAGVPQSCVQLPVTGEVEGLAADDVTGELYYGLRSPRSVNKVSPAWTGSLDHNVLVNGTAECGHSGTTNTSVTNVPGWSNVGKMSTVRYGGASYPSATSSGPADRGSVFFSGGDEDTATLTQTVSLAKLATDVSAGRLGYTLDGWLGGYAAQTDNAKVVVTFKNSSGVSVGSAQIGPVTHTNRKDTTGLLRRTSTGAVPTTAASATVVVTAAKDKGTNNDGYSDSLSLVFARTP